MFYYKLGQTLLQIGAASILQIVASVFTKLWHLLQIKANVVTNWAASLLKIGAECTTNWGSYYKLGQLLQIGA